MLQLKMQYNIKYRNILSSKEAGALINNAAGRLSATSVAQINTKQQNKGAR